MVSHSAPALPRTPARYATRVGHRRRDPLEYEFTQRSSTWLVDLDALPTLPRGWERLVRFEAADHLGQHRSEHGTDGDSSIRANLNRFLAEHDEPAPEHVLMLANPRVLGYVFNPLSVFYCYDARGRLAHTVAEVHNTYGGRHAYLVRTDPQGRAETDKAFYVSPFYPVDGRYTMALPEPGEQLTATVTLHRAQDRPFAAVLTGRRTSARSLWAALGSPLATRAIMFGIRRHGITLYLKGLRPHPRPSPEPAKAPAHSRKAR